MTLTCLHCLHHHPHPQHLTPCNHQPYDASCHPPSYSSVSQRVHSTPSCHLHHLHGHTPQHFTPCNHQSHANSHCPPLLPNLRQSVHATPSTHLTLLN